MLWVFKLCYTARKTGIVFILKLCWGIMRTGTKLLKSLQITVSSQEIKYGIPNSWKSNFAVIRGKESNKNY